MQAFPGKLINLKWNVIKVCVTIVLSLNCAAVTCTGHCRFQGYVSNCTVTIKNIQVKTFIVINHCHDPIDVTFFVKANQPSVDWRYTFVTSNVAEMQTIPDFGDNMRVDLHVILRNNRPNEVIVQADYHTDMQGGEIFLDSTVTIRTFADCNKSLASSPGSASRIALAVTFISLLAMFVGGLILWIYRKQYDSGDQTLLVDDMEVGLPGAVPYQEGAAGEKQQSDKHFPFRVAFTAREQTFDTVIENNFAQESPVASEDTTRKGSLGG